MHIVNDDLEDAEQQVTFDEYVSDMLNVEPT